MDIDTALSGLGLDSWHSSRIDREMLQRHRLARVVSVDKGGFFIRNEHGTVLADLTGKLRYAASSPLDYPITGDWVYAQYFDNDSFAVIHEILPRKTVLQRKAAGKAIDVQLIAANIDTAFIVQSLDANYNIRRLERYLVMAEEGGIRPVSLLSKSDLIQETELADKISAIRTIMPYIEVIGFSNKTAEGLESIKFLLQPAQTFCLLGSSGVGKTTLINRLLGEERFDTQEIREKDSKGRHTTTRRELITLESGAILIDTPGMRELGALASASGSGIEDTFQEISELVDQCRFSDCSHTTEAGCAVLGALKEGLISKERYKSYLKLERESALNRLSLFEKRQKDKRFGKMIKSVMKHNIKK